MPQNSLYDILGLSIDASPEEIKASFRDLAQRLHPDKNVNPGETELFIDVQRAYEILSDPEKKSTYDHTLVDETTKGLDPLIIESIYSRSKLTTINEPQLLYVLINILSQPNPERDYTPPINASLILDTSTSMQGAMIDTVKSTAIKLVRQLRPEDNLSIITFNDRAEVLIPAGTRLDRTLIESKIRMLQTSGGTEIYQGLEAGYIEVKRLLSDKNINHIILITDGRTYGDEGDCIELGLRAASEGLGISGLGIGSKWNDSFLDKLASITGGSCMYISKPSDILFFLTEKFAGLSQSYAEHVSYTFELGPGVDLQYAFRLHPEASPLEITSPLIFGSVPRKKKLSILLELLVKSVPIDTKQVTITEGYLTAVIPTNPTPTYSENFLLSRPTSPNLDTEPPPQPIVQAMSQLTLYRMQERANTELKEGNVRDATRRLQNIATHLLSNGQLELARTVLSEVAYIQQNQSFSDEGAKRIKFGTRSLLLPPNIKDQASD
jgi:Ca-activated chloride channel family protein